MAEKRIIIAGGSGFLGRSLARHLSNGGYDVVVLTRGEARVTAPVRFLHWDGKTLGPWAEALEDAAAVVNYAGRSVNCRYTPRNRREILDSRIDSIRVIGQAITRCATPPRVWVQGASAAIYGDAGETPCTEATRAGTGFSPEVCAQWEASFHSTPTPHTRRVLLRIGFALGRDGGALDTLAKLTRCFLGGTVGSGRQWISWLHVHDLNRLICWSIENPHVEGTHLAVGPSPVRNAHFMRELRRALHRPWSPPAPAWAVRVGSILLGTESELALWGRRCSPAKLLDAGFRFQFPELREALRDLYALKPESTKQLSLGRSAP